MIFFLKSLKKPLIQSKKDFDISINNQKIPITIIKKRNTKSLRIKGGESIVVSIPYYVSYNKTLDLMKNHYDFIYKAFNNQKNYKELYKEDKLELLGSVFNIKYTETPSRPYVKMIDNDIIIYAKLGKEKAERLRAFLKNQAYNFTKMALVKYLNMVDRDINSIFIKDAKTRWGTCSSKGNISINFRLVLAPKFVMEYVIAHEVAHLVHMNHSRDFWNLVEEIFPNYKEAKDWLGKNGKELQNIKI